MQRFKLQPGMKVQLFAAEPMFAHAVAFAFDEQGRIYTAESYRVNRGVTDNRSHKWTEDDLASRTIQDRLAMYRKHLKEKYATYEKEHDIIRILEDTDGDGKADKATVFADGFNKAEEGIGAGILVRKGSVYYTNIPNLWYLKDTKGTGSADVLKSMSYGFGIHVAFMGHDMHGLRFGPDGRVYWSIGDRGINVKTPDGKSFFYPDTGCVMRCEPDGSNFEVFASGLRNPQELAFDDFGNLFTCDNQSDGPDRARWVNVVEGGDSGWRIYYQYGSTLDSRSMWNREKLWNTQHEGQPAYIVPPVQYLAQGPSGLTYYPGTGLPDRYANHFFLCDFRGGPTNSGIYSFALKPKGASFEIVDQHQFIWSVLPTDCEFGPDGAFYLSDWVNSFGLTGKGRIYRFTDPEQVQKPVVQEVKKLLGEGFDHRPTAELAKLLEHVDRRVRQEAQFTLADRGKEAVTPLTEVAKNSKNRLARYHAMWGLEQIARKNPAEGAGPMGVILGLLSDPDADIRAQAVRTAGSTVKAYHPALVQLLKDPEPRVSFQAALALGPASNSPMFGLKDTKETPEAINRKSMAAVREMLRENADKDVYVRHAGIMALTRFSTELLGEAGRDPSPSVRLATVVAYRKLGSPKVADFLKDSAPLVAIEAARAIHDTPITDALPQLAAMSSVPNLPDLFLFRAMNAHFLLGKAENAAVVAAVAARPSAPDRMRVESLRMLANWARPPRRDAVTGITQSLPERSPTLAADAIRPALGGIFSGPSAVRTEGARVAAALGIKEVGPALAEIISDRMQPPAARVAALRGLDSLKDAGLTDAMKTALADPDPRVRNEGRRVQVKFQPEEAVKALDAALQGQDLTERQGAMAILGEADTPVAEAVIGRWLDQLLAKQVPAELQLDLLEAAGKRSTEAVKEKLARYEAGRATDDPLAAYREALTGGNAEAGMQIFLNKLEVACLRCHKVGGEGGDVGPDLSKVGAQQKREYLLESIVAPNRQIAKGFETINLALKDGKTITGIVRDDDGKQLRIITAEAQIITIPKDQIEARESGKSPMPEDVMKNLTRFELRDLVEFLANQK
jgi:quinoprotein glucose dehydrogenase